MRQNRHAVATHKPVARAKRPYDTLQPTQQWKRRKQLQSAITEAEQQVSCPVEALHLQQRTTPEELLHLTTAERERIRTVPSLRIPCEQSMIKCKQLHHCLLRSDDWTAADIDAWRTAVNDIHSNWRAETSINAFPKLHMLHHSVDFAERHRFLGRASEAQIVLPRLFQRALSQAASQPVQQHC